MTPPVGAANTWQTLRPTKVGWHILEFSDGSLAILRWDGPRGWTWGSQRPPTATVATMGYLGNDITTASVNLGTKWAKQIGANLWPVIATQIDTGGLGRGQPLVVSSKGGLQAGTTRNRGDATPINQIPSPIPPSVGNSHLDFSSVLDFLGYLAWILHPQTLLRAVEFVFGALVTMWGVYLLTGASAGRRGPTSHPIIRRAVGATPGGRILRTHQGRRMGRHEGQREAARMEARQAETRSQRESSALEREQINRRARESAREN